MKLLKNFITLAIITALLTGCEVTDKSDDLVIGGTYTAYEPPSSAVQTQANDIEIEDEELPEDENISDENNSESSDGTGWQLRDLILYSIENSMYADTTAPDGSSLRLTVPSITYSYKDMLKFLSDNAYMKKNYTISETMRDKSSYASFGQYGQHADASVERMICGQKIDNINNADDEVMYSDILISVGQDYNTYNEPNYFSIVVNSTSITSDLQNMIYELLASEIDAQIAEYVVYAKDSEEANPNDLYDTIPTVDGRGNLIVKRSISGGGLLLELDFQDSDEFDENRYLYYDHEYKPVYNESRITLADIFKGDFGGNDPTDDEKFFDKFMMNGGRSDAGFNQTIKNDLSVITNEGTNKIYRNYKFNFNLTKGCNMDIADAPYFNCNVTAYFDSRSNNNYITGDGSFIAGYTEYGMCEEEEAMNELIDASREKILCLFPSMNTSGLTYENFSKGVYNLYGNYTATTADIPVNASVRVDIGTQYVQETDEDGNTVETDIPLRYYSKVTFSLS